MELHDIDASQTEISTNGSDAESRSEVAEALRNAEAAEALREDPNIALVLEYGRLQDAEERLNFWNGAGDEQRKVLLTAGFDDPNSWMPDETYTPKRSDR